MFTDITRPLLLNARATKVGSLPFFSQNQLPWQRPFDFEKEAQIDNLQAKLFHSMKRLPKSV